MSYRSPRQRARLYSYILALCIVCILLIQSLFNLYRMPSIDREHMHKMIVKQQQEFRLMKVDDVASLQKAKFILIMSTGSWNNEFSLVVDTFEKFNGSVRFLIFAPKSLCYILREIESVTCFVETGYLKKNNRLPVITKMLKVGLDSSIPGVTEWIGIVNADILFDESLMETLDLISDSGTCEESSCVIVGQRTDVDFFTAEEQLHSVYGMDYFIFNPLGIKFAIDNLPPFVIGRVRWDSYSMGYFAFSNDIHVIDATNNLRALHYMDMSNSYKSKRSIDVSNQRLANEIFRLGRTDNANFWIDSSLNTLVKGVDELTLQSKYFDNVLRWKFDLFIEVRTNFEFSPAGLPITCLCSLLKIIVGISSSRFPEANDFCQNISETQNKIPRCFVFKELFELMLGHSLNTAELKQTSNLDDVSSIYNNKNLLEIMQEKHRMCCVLNYPISNKEDRPKPDMIYDFRYNGPRNNNNPFYLSGEDRILCAPVHDTEI